MALGRYVITQTTTVPAGAAATPIADVPCQGGRAAPRRPDDPRDSTGPVLDRGLSPQGRADDSGDVRVDVGGKAHNLAG
jgi:hypothetical protein